jgi:hypothetical protein
MHMQTNPQKSDACDTDFFSDAGCMVDEKENIPQSYAAYGKNNFVLRSI